MPFIPWLYLPEQNQVNILLITNSVYPTRLLITLSCKWSIWIINIVSIKLKVLFDFESLIYNFGSNIHFIQVAFSMLYWKFMETYSSSSSSVTSFYIFFVEFSQYFVKFQLVRMNFGQSIYLWGASISQTEITSEEANCYLLSRTCSTGKWFLLDFKYVCLVGIEWHTDRLPL